MELQIWITIALALAAGLLKVAKDKPKVANQIAAPIGWICDVTAWATFVVATTLLSVRVLLLVEFPQPEHAFTEIDRLRMFLVTWTTWAQVVMAAALAVDFFLVFSVWFGRRMNEE